MNGGSNKGYNGLAHRQLDCVGFPQQHQDQPVSLHNAVSSHHRHS